MASSGSSFCLPFIIFFIGISSVLCFDTDEMEVFDAVEEINQNFYTLLDIPQNADASAIKKAFRRLSLVLHPDKNDAPDAEVQFRQLVAMYDILKDPNKRRCYDNVLVNGLPDWKHAVYYYRRVRKMGLVEMSAILFVIISIGQYLVGWAAYLEKKYTVEEYISSKSKKLQRKQKKGKPEAASLIQEFEIELPKPSAMDTLPFQIPRLIWFLLVSAPPLTYQWLREYLEERQRQKLLQAEEQEESSDDDPLPVQPRQPRRRKPAFSVPEIKDGGGPTVPSSAVPTTVPSSVPPVISGGLWTDDDLLELTRLVKKYPMGTTERWERIGEALGRPAGEVAHMAHKIKDNMVRTLNTRRTQKQKDIEDEEEGEENSSSEGEDREEDEEQVVVEEPKKVKTRGGKHGGEGGGAGGGGSWSQVQQKAFETALAKFPKGTTADRWEKIAKCVPGKSREECMQRFKQLVDIVKKKKEQESNNAESTQQADTTQQCVQATESST